MAQGRIPRRRSSNWLQRRRSCFSPYHHILLQELQKQQNRDSWEKRRVLLFSCICYQSLLRTNKVAEMLDGTPPANLRQHQCTNAQFKKFMILFARDKRAFYELHTHSLILLEVLWQKEKSKSDLNPMHGFNAAFEQTLNLWKEVIEEVDEKSGVEQIVQLFSDLEVIKKHK